LERASAGSEVRSPLNAASDSEFPPMPHLIQTTILGVRHRGGVAIAGDGQVTLERTVMKHRANKVRRMYNGQVLAGFAGSAADAISLFQRFEGKLEEHRGNLRRAAVELSKEWRTDRILRRLEALLVVLDKDAAFLLSGSGDVIEPDDGLVAVGSGGPFALAAARALVAHTDMDAATVAREAMKIAAGICIYTNDQITVESL
jgi:ATP-dependent HslUV protease, peptidase subunit HslV